MIKSTSALPLGEALNQSGTDPDTSLDLSMKEIYAIIYYPDSDPGQEYDIRNSKELLDWSEMKKGDTVQVKFGYAKMQGTVVSVSDNYDYLIKNYDLLLEDHREELREEEKKTPNFSLKRRILNWLDEDKKRTQSSPPNKPKKGSHIFDLNPQQEEVHRAMADVVLAYERFHQLLTNCEKGVEDLKSLRLDEMTTSLRDASMSPSSSSSNGVEVLKPSKNRSNSVDICDFNEKVRLGPNGTEVPKSVFETINWNSYSAATRKLLVTVFTRQVLATHSLTGKRSPAFLQTDKEAKAQLDPVKVADIVNIVGKKCKVAETLVRGIITTKCSDENKMLMKRSQRNKENNSPEQKKQPKF